MQNIHLQFSIQIKTTNLAHTGESFMDIHHKKNLILFDSFGLDVFKFFITDNDESIIDELLYNFKNCKDSLTNQKLTLCTIKLFMNS